MIDLRIGSFNRRLRLGDLLIEYGVITKEQLQEGLKIQKETGIKIGEALIKLGYLTNQNINEVLEYQLGIPFIRIEEYDIEVNATKTITEEMARKHLLIPVKQTDTEVYIAMADPLNIFAIDDVKIFSGKEVIPLLAEDAQIQKAIEMYYGSEKAMLAAEQFKQERALDLDKTSDNTEESEDSLKSAPIVKLVNTMMEQAVRYRASDIHIEPYEDYVRVRFRVDGDLKQMFEYDATLLSAIVARVKILGEMDIAEKRKPQDGRVSIIVDKIAYDIRISSLPTVYGEKIVMRINNKDSFNKGKTQLGFFSDDLEKFENILSNPYGIILVTGPTGSGKSTTLYTVLNEINKENINIVTVEDPVESQIKGINQVQINTKAGLTFASTLRSILRQDPDVIMIGEIRDAETAEIAVKSSITGHLVVSTLHTNDAASAIIRLIDMGIEPFLLGASVVGIIAQRLVRKLCSRCKKPYHASDYEKKILGADESKDLELYSSKGCHLCNESGYSGRIGVYEIMPITDKLRASIASCSHGNEIREIALLEGLNTLKKNASRLVLNGTTTIEEMLRIAYGKE